MVKKNTHRPDLQKKRRISSKPSNTEKVTPNLGEPPGLGDFVRLVRDNPSLRLSAYLAPEGYVKLALESLQRVVFVYERLIICKGTVQKCPWAQDLFPAVTVLPVSSISDAAQKLRCHRIPWTSYSPRLFRRTELILEEAQSSKQRESLTRELEFPPEDFDGFHLNALKNSWGTMCLLTENLMLTALKSSRPFPLGIPQFKQFKEGPPSRAYLKLFEALTFCGVWPQKSDLCLEIGAAPGGWTWVLKNLGAQIISYDRAPLDPPLMAHPAVTHHQKDAFQALPEKLPAESVERLSWIFSDIICYPDKLLSWVKSWLSVRPNLNFVCTLKFQGDTHYEIIPQFMEIPGSQIVHLHHNKHELTWIRCHQSF